MKGFSLNLKRDMINKKIGFIISLGKVFLENFSSDKKINIFMPEFFPHDLTTEKKKNEKEYKMGRFRPFITLS